MRTLLAAVTLALVVVLVVVAATLGRDGPEARFKSTPRAPQVGQLATFDASGSTCTHCRYRWDVVRGGKASELGTATGKRLRHRFRTPGAKTIRLTVIDREGRRSRRSRKLTVKFAGRGPGPAPVSPLPPLGRPSCVPGATPATTAAQVRSAVDGGQNVCVTADVGDVSLDGLRGDTVRHVGTSPSGALGAIHVDDASRITVRARFRSTIITDSDFITIEQSRIGGTEPNRTLDTLIFIPERSDDVTIRDSDIGWTTADNSGNTGFGLRVYHGARLRIERNYIHHIAGDAMQFGMDDPDVDAIVDRNEVAYAARPRSSTEHSDDLQIVGNGPNMQVTNNYFHHCGWFTATGPTTGCNSMAIHAGTSNSLLFENNLEAHALGLPFIGDLGTGGTRRSNATFRNNTWWNNGTQFPAKPDLQFGLDGGAHNRWERNLVVSKLNFSGGAGFARSGTIARHNLVGSRAMSADGQCTAAACNAAGKGRIGYRKPAGVRW